MKHLVYILLFSVLGITANGQKIKMLNAIDFKDQKIDDQWVYVKYKDAKALQTARHPQALNLVHPSNESQISNVIKLKVPKGKDPIDYCNELRRTQPDLIYADPIVQYVPLSIPSDVLVSNQFYLDNIKAYDAWNITKGDDDITIGIIDTGIDLDHEDMITNLWINTDDPVDGVDNDGNGYVDDYLGYDFADVDSDPSIQNGNHGMIVAGIAGATTDNGKGIAGLGYNTKVAALKGFRSSNGLSGGLYEAIIYAADNGFDVVNLSWGRMGSPLQSEQDIINYAVLDHDMVVVAAAGNEGGKITEENKWYPASYENVLSVGASDALDNKSSGSTFNHSVDLLAPGVSMFSTVNNNGYSNGGPGTSFASPLVSAAAALVKDQYPNLTAIQIMERVRATADDVYNIGNNSVYDGKLGKGRLNVLRAVSESNVKSLRAENPTLTSSFGENVFFGDTVQVTATLTNHLSPINSASVTISSPNDDFTISKGNFLPGFMNTQDTQEISFDVVLNEDVAPETAISIRLDYASTGYSDFQFLEVTTSPDYVDFGNSNVTMTISGDGDTGFDEYGPNSAGSGFQYQLDTLMSYTGLLLATSATTVSSNIISNYSSLNRSQDFDVQRFYKLSHHPGADHFGYSEFTDSNKPLIIEQSNLTWKNKDYLILRYRVVNNSAVAISGLSFGIFADWDLGDKNTNYAAYDLAQNYIYARNSSDNLYAGVQVVGGDSFEFSALDMAALNGNTQDVNVSFNNSDKYDFLVNQAIPTAGGMGDGNDVATLNGITINQIDPYAEAFIDVIYAVSDSKINLEAEFADAQTRLDEFILKPRIQETFSVCAGSSLSVNPSDGTMYEFYEDPLAQNLITKAESFNAGVITKDTLFYVRNVDNNYPSDILGINVKLFNEIADFEMSTDTLYLDNSTNVVQFTDQSLDAISWSWDFGQGTIASIQNPSLSFSNPGTYTVVLEVENALGCIDTFSRDLVVANRPGTPSFSDIVICPNEEVTLSDPSAESLHLYAFQTSTSPYRSGSTITLTDIEQDTVLYVSGVYGSFESQKTPVNIDVLEVSGTITHSPDTTSESNQIVFSATNVDPGSTVEWTINGTPYGSTELVTIPAIAGTMSAMLEITSSEACTKTIEKEILVSSSPFASQPDLLSCFNQPVEIRPANGTYFGFYEDPELNTLIKKGTHLVTNTHSKVYIVNLDDGLPGIPIEVNISNETVTFEVSQTITEIGLKHQVDFSIISDDDITTHTWYINGVLTETSRNPTFFLDKELYEIVVVVTSASGCESTDTLSLDFTPPLALNDEVVFTIYPNPSSGRVKINSKETIDRIVLIGLDGKEILRIEEPGNDLDLTQLPKGLYLLRAQTGQSTQERQLIIR